VTNAKSIRYVIKKISTKKRSTPHWSNKCFPYTKQGFKAIGCKYFCKKGGVEQQPGTEIHDDLSYWVGGSGVIKFNPAQRGRCQRYPQEEANHSQNVFQLQKEY
jgi:hypothetical protein